jgi:hypothetical protein
MPRKGHFHFRIFFKPSSLELRKYSKMKPMA